MILARSRQKLLRRVSVAVLGLFTLGVGAARASDQPSTLSPSDLRIYESAHTVVDWKPREIHARKELKGLESAGSQGDLTQILQETGKHVTEFFMNFPNLTATESIQWTVDHETSQSSAMGEFRYFLVRGPALGGENFQEYRADAQGKSIDYNNLQYAPVLTSRFTASMLFFDPHNLTACRYRYLGTQMLDEKEADVVGFAQIPDAHLSLADFSDAQHTVPLLFQGLAWIDHTTRQILRIQTELLAPPPHSSLREEVTRIDFVPFHIPLIDLVAVLPKTVVVDVWLNMDELLNLKTRVGGRTAVSDGLASAYLQHSRNIHIYSDYKLYLGH